MAWFTSALRATAPASVRRHEEAATTPVPPPGLSLVPSIPVPAPKPRRTAAKPARIVRLYPEPPKPAVTHARALLDLVREEMPDAVGAWLIASDLARTYAELTKREGWRELSWCSIGRELGKLTRRRTVKRHGKRHVAYLLR